MTEVVLYHHVQGLTAGVRSFADELRHAGHTVHTPDLFDGRTFDTIEEGMAFAREAGFGALAERGVAAAESIAPEVVFAGFSFGVMIAQQLAQTGPGARGALLMYSCLPVSEFGDAWPEGVPVQVHGKDADPFFAEDLEAAQALVDSTDRGSDCVDTALCRACWSLLHPWIMLRVGVYGRAAVIDGFRAQFVVALDLA